MTDDNPVRIEGYALTHALDGTYFPRAEMQRAVKARPEVLLRVRNKIVGHAQLSVDDTGLRVSAVIEPTGTRTVGWEEGAPVTERVHDTALPYLINRTNMCFVASMTDSPWEIGGVSLAVRPVEEATDD